MPALLSNAFRLLRGLLLFSMSAAGSVVAALGMGLLSYLLLSRALTPPQHLYTRTLYLDYSKADLIAQAAFLPADELQDGVIPSGLPPGTRSVEGRLFSLLPRARAESPHARMQRRPPACCQFTSAGASQA